VDIFWARREGRFFRCRPETSTLFEAKNFRFFENYGVSAWTRGEEG